MTPVVDMVRSLQIPSQAIEPTHQQPHDRVKVERDRVDVKKEYLVNPLSSAWRMTWSMPRA